MSWPLVKLGTLCKVVRGSSPRPKGDPKYYGGNVPRLMVSDVTRDGKFVTPKIDFLTEAGAEKSRPMKKGDFIIAVSGQPGQALILAIDACIHDGFAGLRELDESKVNKDYLFHFMNATKERFSASATGAIFKNLTTEQIRELEIPLPPLNEQQRIAAILDKADSLSRKRQQAIELADDFLRSVFLDMFGDPVSNPKKFPVSRIDNICKIVRGSSPRPKGDPKYYGPGVPRLMVADLTRDGKYVTPMIDSLTVEGAKKSRFTSKGTVVMAVSGNVGLTSILAIDACIHDGFIAFNELDEEKVKPEFLQELMMFLKVTHSTRQAGAIFQNLTTSQIKEMEIPLPPTELQNKFITVSKLKTEIVEKYSTLGLFESLSQKAFAGKL
ncbi:restriction endonuclease subunit S [Pseudoalteromonas sp. SSMSWG5]|uniref:restriction endonuclease subunit S n=1 Tax=Pseudoalteromonas sp. SSMSWG5 TaxID=3139396 RepID=UPI003BAA67FD